MTQTKSNSPKSLNGESERAIAFLEKISAALKRERRNFDDAVVIHCIRLIRDYVAEDVREFDTGTH